MTAALTLYLADVATLDGLRGLLRTETDPAILDAARERVQNLSALDPRRVCCRCHADLGQAETKGDTHGLCEPCFGYEIQHLHDELVRDYAALSAA